MSKVRVRFAPSPTGYLHVGGARTALYNWLFARHEKGDFILRIEDTDAERSTDESTTTILEALRWLGLDWDEGPEVGGPVGPYRQADRLKLYHDYAQRLLDEGKAYYCICTPEELEARRKAALAAGTSPRYDGRCRQRGNDPAGADGRGAVVRLLVGEEGTIEIADLVHGPIRFETGDLDDFILLRSDGMPTYNFAVVVDDVLMGMTHVIRGDDHISNTPRQIVLYEALDLPIPHFAHIPMILGADRSRLSKRHGATSVLAYQQMGYLPEAVVNYLARLGWSYGDQEIFTQDELVGYFSLERVGKTPAVFDPVKLEWLNGQYIKRASADRLTALLKPFWGAAGVSPEGLAGMGEDRLQRMVCLFQERARTLTELASSSRFVFDGKIERDAAAALKVLTPEAKARVRTLAAEIEALPTFTAETLETLFRTRAAALGIKLVDLAQPFRVALSGKTVSPPIFPIMELMGWNAVRRRVEEALEGEG
ncbi:glutamyl-tRNA synthetase [Candidatus Methylomirabilis lanthanidiphila]|uniref:Glutamate--tRNA ligase n=1 Tax=Candidatus Methylomirabilis lanthanidiphila TaxID=2211376 RepID=A0A564ZIA3_9BACT|nr:glutamate--tRNA ligase [Candidatus Methylomirabilis lanthanidiphila]VUZ84836.1 glutamyl-tRNA synthetase [Candidatus Methylomirabilis lanthanidiphila]